MFSKIRSLIFKVDPEKAHTLAIKSLKFNIVPNLFDENKNDPIFQTKIFDKDLDNPIGMVHLKDFTLGYLESYDKQMSIFKIL